MSHPIKTLVALLVVLGSVRAGAAEFPNVINEGMNTNHFVLVGNVPATDPSFSSDYSLSLTNGNPDSLLRVTFDYSTGNIGDAEQTFNVYTNLTWTPSVDGAIAALSFSIDVRTVQFDLLFSEVGFSVSDSGGGTIAGFTPLPNTGGWTTISVTNLTALDFGGRDFAGTLPLRFGFSLIGPTPTSNTAATASIDLDNFKVSVTTVPEPGSVALIGVGAVLLVGLRRRFRP